jgi:hypothetical protein
MNGPKFSKLHSSISKAVSYIMTSFSSIEITDRMKSASLLLCSTEDLTWSVVTNELNEFVREGTLLMESVSIDDELRANFSNSLKLYKKEYIKTKVLHDRASNSGNGPQSRLSSIASEIFGKPDSVLEKELDELIPTIMKISCYALMINLMNSKAKFAVKSELDELLVKDHTNFAEFISLNTTKSLSGISLLMIPQTMLSLINMSISNSQIPVFCTIMPILMDSIFNFLGLICLASTAYPLSTKVGSKMVLNTNSIERDGVKSIDSVKRKLKMILNEKLFTDDLRAIKNGLNMKV